MKRLNILLFISMFTVGLFSCEKEEYADASYNYVGVFASKVSTTVVEGTFGPNEFVIPMQYLAPGAGEVSITFTVTGSAKLGTDFTVPAASSTTDNTFTLSLPSSDKATPVRYEFSIMTIENQEESAVGDLLIEAEITATPAGVFTSYPLSASFSTTLFDDDCAYDLSSINGVLAGSDVTLLDSDGNDVPYTSVASFTYVDDNTIMIEDLGVPWMNDAWGEDVTTYYPVTLKVDDFGVNITIEPQVVMETLYGGAPQDPYTIEGTGLINTCAGTITIQYSLTNYGTNWAEYYYENDAMATPDFVAVLDLP
jgi:hypothetical protein